MGTHPKEIKTGSQRDVHSRSLKSYSQEPKGKSNPWPTDE